jgi:hypothetical protein
MNTTLGLGRAPTKERDEEAAAVVVVVVVAEEADHQGRDSCAEIRLRWHSQTCVTLPLDEVLIIGNEASNRVEAVTALRIMLSRDDLVRGSWERAAFFAIRARLVAALLQVGRGGH